MLYVQFLFYKKTQIGFDRYMYKLISNYQFEMDYL